MQEQKHNIKKTDSPDNVAVSAYGNLDDIIQERGYRDGQIFCTPDKATYTFVYDDDVVALHFDARRHDLFLKGRKLHDQKDAPHLDEFLERFKRALAIHATGKSLLKAFSTAVSQLKGD